MNSTLVLFSGLPGTGKTTLARSIAQTHSWPLVSIDDVAGPVPPGADYRFWDEKVLVLLQVIETQLSLGVSVVADSVFMGSDRWTAQELAHRWNARFRPVACTVADRDRWKERVEDRHRGDPTKASWSQVEHQAHWYQPWPQRSALLLEGSSPLAANLTLLASYLVTGPEVPLVRERSPPNHGFHTP